MNIRWFLFKETNHSRNMSVILVGKISIQLDEKYTQDEFTVNMPHSYDIKNIVAFKWHSAHAYIANQFKDKNFKKNIALMYETLSAQNSKANGRSNCGQSRSNVHCMVLCGNNEDGWEEYNYCRSHTNPNFGSYYSLMAIAYSGCDENNLVYKACQHEQKLFFNAGIMAVSNNLRRVVDTTCPYFICG